MGKIIGQSKIETKFKKKKILREMIVFKDKDMKLQFEKEGIL